MLLLTTVVLGVAAGLVAADKKVQMKDLPPAVQKAVQQEESKGAKIVGLAKETEAGKTMYEVETTISGHTRDLLFDPTGKLVETEEETPIAAVPAAVKTAFESRGKVLKVETLTKGTSVTYEAQVEKNGKKSEVVVDAAGKPVKP
jgi:uncharacterized membrane protein YkoI